MYFRNQIPAHMFKLFSLRETMIVRLYLNYVNKLLINSLLQRPVHPRISDPTELGYIN